MSQESKRLKPGDAGFDELVQAYREVTELYQRDGVLVAGDALQPVVTATSVTRGNGSIEMTDGPFAETREQLGGYYLPDCATLDDALAYAAKIPAAAIGWSEVRPSVAGR